MSGATNFSGSEKTLQALLIHYFAGRMFYEYNSINNKAPLPLQPIDSLECDVASCKISVETL